MNAQTNADMNPQVDSPQTHAADGIASAKVRPVFWSLRRELWENRSIYIAPITVAALILVSALVNVLSIPAGAVPFQRLLAVQPGYFRAASVGLYAGIATIMAITVGLVTWFYCLDALFSERRDRSVLFWKSLPVSDTTTVLCKVIVAQLVIPVIAMLVGFALYIVLLLVMGGLMIANGVSGTLLLGNAPIGQLLLVHAYLLIAASLWYAPVQGWLLFVSSWARRATFLWAILAPAAVGLAEYLAFETNHFWTMIATRFSGGLKFALDSSAMAAFDESTVQFDPNSLPSSLFDLLDPAKFLSQPGLWGGIVVAAAFIAATIWMRRYREPV